MSFISALAKKPPSSELVESLMKKSAAEGDEFMQAPLSVLALDESPIPGSWPLFFAPNNHFPFVGKAPRKACGR